MFIKLVCPNGHKLKVKEAHAGQRAVCPKCEARLTVPQPKAKQISDTSVLAVLGDISATRSVVIRQPIPAVSNASASDATAPDAPAPASGFPMPEKRKCVKCHTLMSAKVRICPKCQLYQPESAITRLQVLSCPTCGERFVHGTPACNGCGAKLPAA